MRAVTKRSIVLNGHKTSVSVEDEFWKGLKAHAEREGRTLSAIVGEIDERRKGNLSSAIRVFLYQHAIDHAAWAASAAFPSGSDVAARAA